MYGLTLPLTAAIHLTVPDVMDRKWTDWYMLTTILAIVWLAVLAYVINLMLEKIGCALGISETVPPRSPRTLAAAQSTRPRRRRAHAPRTRRARSLGTRARR